MTTLLLSLACSTPADGEAVVSEQSVLATPSAPDEPRDVPTDVPPHDTTTPELTPPTEFPSSPGEPLALCINELVPDSEVSFVEADGQPSDWIELHNPTGVDVGLGGWSITDDSDDPHKHWLDPTLVVPAGGFLVLHADDRTELGPDHVGFSLDGEGEMVGLYAPDGNGSVLWYPAVPSDLALARVTDCCADAGDTAEDTGVAVSCFEYRFAGTPGATNE
jgi:hypothetical protein